MSDTPALLIDWAATLGRHALPLYAATLFALLVASACAWWLARRIAWPRQDSALPPPAFLLARLGIGFAIVIAAATLFAEVADELGDGRLLGDLDTAFSDALRASVAHATLQAFAWLTRLGDAWTQTGICVAVALLLIVLRRHWLALGWVVAIAGNGILNTSLKAIFARARPVHEHGLILADGWSFPSGHSSGSVVVYGMLAYVAMRFVAPRWHLPLLLLATALAFSIGTSRVFLQVHYPSDVLAGFASGTAWLLVCVVSIELTRHYRRHGGWRPGGGEDKGRRP